MEEQSEQINQSESVQNSKLNKAITQSNIRDDSEEENAEDIQIIKDLTEKSFQKLPQQ